MKGGISVIIKNAKVYTKDRNFKKGEVYIRGDVFSDFGAEGEVIDAGGCYAVPGLIDLHIHGCKGYDFCDGTPEAISKIAEYELSVGVTSFAPATMTLSLEELERILSVAAENPPKKGASLVGVNMEGPFISAAKKGAQNEEYIRKCNADEAQRLIDAGKGLVKFIAVAPEENEDFEDFIAKMKGKVTISLAHTNADYETAMEAFRAGAKHAVHLYNAMPAFSHREPGVVGAVADSRDVTAEMICDGIHIHPATVRATFRMLGADRIVLISDSMRAAGMPDGRYTLGGLEVDVKAKKAVLVSDGAIAGSAYNLMDCLRTAVLKMRIPLTDAVACATVNPARCLGIDDKYGSIEPGKKADMLLLDEDLNLKAVIKNGERVTV